MVQIVISCEHAGNQVPSEYQSLFTKELLSTHRGYDLGASYLAESLGKPVIENRTTRLLIDVNRSIGSPSLFSYEFSDREKEKIIETYYIPYRHSVLQAVEAAFGVSQEVLHLSIHSFTPELNGKKREVDIGLLFDPARVSEAHFCKKLSDFLKRNSSLIIRDNEPYLGVEDGLTNTLRSLFGGVYMGIEIEVNQRFSPDGVKMDTQIIDLLQRGLSHAIQ